MNATVKDIMTSQVVTVQPDTSFKQLAVLLGTSRVSAFPVTDGAGGLIGVVSEADMMIKEADQGIHVGLFAGLRRGGEHEKAVGLTAADIMTRAPVTIGPDEPVERAAFLMYDHGVKRLPVVDAAGHLAGIVSRADVLSVFARPDEDILRDVSPGVLLSRFPGDAGRLEITVADGIVTLAGWPETDELGHQIVEAARHVNGVVAVEDRLFYSGQRSPAEP